jgi:hypothetical protein
MKRFSLFIFFTFASCIIHCAFSQNPLVKMWDKRFGGTDQEELTCIQQTVDGGYILGGYSYSNIGGDKTQDNWDLTGNTFDYWIIKIDSLGNKQWDKRFGGTSDDYLVSLQQTADNGYILAGISLSGISGDKTQATWGNSIDYWIIKTDSLGSKQWDKDFGGTDYEMLFSVKQTADGGYIFGGPSFSGIGGDKTQANWGNLYDYWVVKTDSLGNKQWDKDYGGTGDDVLTALQQTTDKGFIFAGSTNSGISGNKTQLCWGSYDYWIVKTDSLGNIEWDQDLGGTDEDDLYSLRQTSDKGFLLGGLSYSGIGGDKTQANFDASGNTYDYWILKTDSLGTKQWDKDYGGTMHEDEFGNVSQSLDGGYLIAGTSYSPISGNKTEANLGLEQSWVVKTDLSGNIVWDKTVFTSAHDETGLAIQTRDGCYVMANNTDGGIAGYKTQQSWGNNDYWIVKFCDTTQIPVTIFTAPTDLCPGTCTNFLNLSLYATTYLWLFPGASPDTSSDINPANICYTNPGSYDVQLIATNANGSDTLLLSNYITVYPSPPPQSITQSGDTLFAIAGSASYQWYFNTNIISGATDYFYVAPQSGDYNIVATDANGCEVEAAIFNIVASAQPAVGSQQLAIFPNPVGETLHVKSLPAEAFAQAGYPLTGAAVEISIYNMLGEMVLAAAPLSAGEGSGGEADVSTLPPGLYYLEIISSGKIFRTRFVKQ